QADSIIDANSVQGMNQYMYTEGNPVNFRDPSGHSLAKSFMGGLKQAMHGFNVQMRKLGDGLSRITGQKKHKGGELNRSEFGTGYKRVFHNPVSKWQASNRNSYSEPYSRRVIKMYWIARICSTGDEVGCKAAEAYAVNDYLNNYNKWEAAAGGIPILNEIVSPILFNNERKKDINSNLDMLYWVWLLDAVGPPTISDICSAYNCGGSQ
ncbi:MAG TPA: hypothetical protein PL169_22190, partial [Leptospiraceae bacterium]|nr:hypothetical protein [Leptospiraceae bacterium]